MPPIGSLIFSNLGQTGTPEQKSTFHALIPLLLTHMQTSPLHPSKNLIAIIPDAEDLNLQSLLLELRLTTFPPTPIPPSIYPLLLHTLDAATTAYSLRELSAQLAHHPTIRGGLGLDIEPPIPIPRDVSPILIAVPAAPDLLLELVQHGRPYAVLDMTPIFDAFEEACDEIARLRVQDSFTGVETRNKGFLFAMRPKRGARGGVSNFEAKAAVQAMMAFLVDFEAGNLVWNVLRPTVGGVGVIGMGTLRAGLGAGNETVGDGSVGTG